MPKVVRRARPVRRALAERRAALEAAGYRFLDSVWVGSSELAEGEVFRVRGRRGWFRFRDAVEYPDGRVEVTGFGPYSRKELAKRFGAFHTFWVADVTRVL